jgi:hypothetical protein
VYDKTKEEKKEFKKVSYAEEKPPSKKPVPEIYKSEIS